MISQSWMPFKVFIGMKDFSSCLGKLKLKFCEHAKKETEELISMIQFRVSFLEFLR